MKDSRFAGKTGEEYELFKITCPHFDYLENGIGEKIKEYFSNKDLERITSLELGVGPGYSTLIALGASKRLHVTAVDNENVMIEQAKEVLSEFIQEERVTLVQDDALEFLKKQRGGSFDIFFSGFTLHNFDSEYRKSCLKEIYRVLKDGGLFVNADKYALDDDIAHKETLDWQLTKFKEEYSRINRPDLIEEWTTHYLKDDQEGIKMKESDTMKDMEKIGFNNIVVSHREQMDALLTAVK